MSEQSKQITCGSDVAVPEELAVCPYCKGALTIHVDQISQMPSGEWVVSQFTLDCDTEPDFDSPHWNDWTERHSNMPYVHMLPLEMKLEPWLHRAFECVESLTETM